MAANDQPGSPRPPAKRGSAAILPEGDDRRVIVLASVLELPPQRRRRAITATLAAAKKGETVVFVTDDLDFSVFVKQRLLYEYLPPIAHQARHPRDSAWHQYLVRRFRILMDKWAPVRIVTHGTPFERFIENARQ